MILHRRSPRQAAKFPRESQQHRRYLVGDGGAGELQEDARVIAELGGQALANDQPATRQQWALGVPRPCREAGIEITAETLFRADQHPERRLWDKPGRWPEILFRGVCCRRRPECTSRYRYSQWPRPRAWGGCDRPPGDGIPCYPHHLSRGLDQLRMPGKQFGEDGLDARHHPFLAGDEAQQGPGLHQGQTPHGTQDVGDVGQGPQSPGQFTAAAHDQPPPADPA